MKSETLENLKKGRTARVKNLIKDPLLYPYYIDIEGEKAYTVFKENDNSIYGYFTTFANALKKVALLKVNLVEDETVRKIDEYIKEYYKQLEIFNKAISI